MLSNWIRSYKENGYNVVIKPKGRPTREKLQKQRIREAEERKRRASSPEFKAYCRKCIYKKIKTNPALNGLIFHSDRGWQYQHKAFQQALVNHGIEQSMSRKGCSPDDGLMEGFFGIFKREMFYGKESTYANLDELEQVIKDYIHYYKMKEQR